MIFQKNWKIFYIEIEAVKMFMKEQFCIVKFSVENVDAKNELQESKELLDLIRQENCVL